MKVRVGDGVANPSGRVKAVIASAVKSVFRVDISNSWVNTMV